MKRLRKDKWQVYGPYGGSFTNLDKAKFYAKDASMFPEGDGIPYHGAVYLIEDGCHYIEYEYGQLVRDGWTKK